MALKFSRLGCTEGVLFFGLFFIHKACLEITDIMKHSSKIPSSNVTIPSTNRPISILSMNGTKLIVTISMDFHSEPLIVCYLNQVIAPDIYKTFDQILRHKTLVIFFETHL